MKKLVLPGLVVYSVSSGLGLFLDPGASSLLLSAWLTGYVILALLVAYDSYFFRKHFNSFPFVVLGIILLNFFIQTTGGSRSPFWPVYFLFAAAVAVFSPVRQTYGAALLILGIEASNLLRAGQWDPDRMHIYAGFAVSLFGVSVAIAHIINRTRHEADLVKDEHDRLIAKADAIDPLADSNNLESLVGRQAVNLQAARERDDTFNGLIEMISRFVPAHSYAVFLRERRESGDVFVLRAIRSESRHSVLPPGAEPREKTYIDVCAEQRQRQYVSDISGMGTPLSKLGYYLGNARDIPVKTFLAMPVIEDDRTIGVIAVDSLEAGAFSLEDQDTLACFEPFFIQIIEKIQMALSLKTRADHFAALHEISTELNSSLKFGEIMNRVLPLLKKPVPFDFCAGVLKTESEGKDQLTVAAIDGYDRTVLGSMFPWDESSLIKSMVNFWKKGGATSHYSHDLGDRGRDIGMFPLKEFSQPIKSLYGRLLIAKGECIGAFFLASLRTDAFNEYQRNLLDTLVNQISMVASNSLLYARIEDLARTDGLTGLLNHRTFMEKLAEESRRIGREPRPFSVLLMDIDKFKNVNDTYGHPVGDVAIKAVARVLQETVRATDFVARYGGEEFAVGMVDTNTKGAEQMAERVRKIMESTVVTRTGTGDLRITLSIGVSSCPEHTAKVQDLVGLSDQALYQAKRTGRNRVCVAGEIKRAAAEVGR